MQDSKSKRGVSVRLDSETLTQFEKLVDGAGMSVSESIRLLLTRALDAQQAIDLTGLSVKCQFNGKAAAEIDNFPEHIGSILLEVSPPACMSIECLHEMVFISPEFWSQNVEPYRIDSAYFHRVTKDRKRVPSDRTSRRVLSFRLIEGKWRAGVFVYETDKNQPKIIEEIREALVLHVTATVVCYLTGLLPDSRRLSQEEILDLNACLLPHMLSK